MDNGLPRSDKNIAGMWVAKPIYEGLPYFYLVVGIITLAASMYVNHWYWPTISFVTGLFCLVAGLVILLKRRDARAKVTRGPKT